MLRSFKQSLWLLAFAVVLTCGIYPLIPVGNRSDAVCVPSEQYGPVGSLLVAQPFTKDEARLSAQDRWLVRLLVSGSSLDSDYIKLAVKQVEAIAWHRNSKRRMHLILGLRG